MGCVKSRESREVKALKRCPLYNEHSTVISHYRFGVTGEKTPEGEVHVGLKAMRTKKTDKEYSRVNGKHQTEGLHKVHPDTSSDLEPSVRDTVPSVLEAMGEDAQPFEIPRANQPSGTTSQEESVT